VAAAVLSADKGLRAEMQQVQHKHVVSCHTLRRMVTRTCHRFYRYP
jgi:hypothetical protein